MRFESGENQIGALNSHTIISRNSRRHERDQKDEIELQQVRNLKPWPIILGKHGSKGMPNNLVILHILVVCALCCNKCVLAYVLRFEARLHDSCVIYVDL